MFHHKMSSKTLFNKILTFSSLIFAGIQKFCNTFAKYFDRKNFEPEPGAVCA